MRLTRSSIPIPYQLKVLFIVVLSLCLLHCPIHCPFLARGHASTSSSASLPFLPPSPVPGVASVVIPLRLFAVLVDQGSTAVLASRFPLSAHPSLEIEITLQWEYCKNQTNPMNLWPKPMSFYKKKFS